MYDVNKFLKNIEKADPAIQVRVAIECLNRFQQSFHPHEAYSKFFDYFLESHGLEDNR